MKRAVWVAMAMAMAGCGGGGNSGGFTIKGDVSNLTTMSLRRGLGTLSSPTTKTVTHVMAVNPETESANRSTSTVSSDGKFSLSVSPGRPYVLVFIDSSQVGLDMIVGVFRDQTLDTLAPTQNGSADLGNVSLDGMTQVATIGTAYDTLLAQLGLSADAALTLGAVDDLSLRMANPDIDADGKIDADNDQHFEMSMHTRTDNIKLGGPMGQTASVSDITNKFLDSTGTNAAYVSFNLTSLYAVYPSSFDSGTYVMQSSTGPSATLLNGASYTVTLTDGTTAAPPTSYSGAPFGDEQQWGADYQLSMAETPGSGGSPAKIVYGLASGKALTFPNVVTRTKAELEASGNLVPFLKLVTADGTATGTISSFAYQFMKRVSATEWTAATDEEVALLVNDDGAHVNFYVGSKSNSAQFTIPRQAAGTINWSGPSATSDTICSMAVSYDDKLGQRIFAGNVDANQGVTPCN
jgi:hypothetical protein